METDTPIGRIRTFVSEVLDRTGDGIIDTETEASSQQLANLLGLKGGVNSATPGEIAASLQKRVGDNPQRLAEEITKAFKSEEDNGTDTYMKFSGYSALHVAEKLGLNVVECRISPAIFQKSVEAYLEGKFQPRKATYVSERLRSEDVTDPYTSSNYKKVNITHVDIKTRFDFERKQIKGYAEYTLGDKREDNKLILDMDGIEVESVWVLDQNGSRTKTPYSLGEKREFLGRPLIIDLPQDAKKVAIQYKTTTKDGERVPALQWLDPIQTSGGQKPFFYTQGQYFYNRGWLPIQDTPAAKITCNITVEVKGDLGLRVVASNNKPRGGIPPTPLKTNDGYDQWKFVVDKPISSYLIAIAIGDFVPHKVSDRSIVYAERNFIETAAEDFKIFDTYFRKAEELFGSAEPFGTLDVLLLPRSFPYGGMENLGINFDHSMVVTGDGSLMSVPLHEITHVWFGNMVTNTSLEGFWINEGFDTYAASAVYKAIHGEDAYNIEATLEVATMEDELKDVENGQKTCLATKVFDKNPEDAVTFTQYEKGFLFVTWLEERMGGEAKMLSFLRKYIERYRFKTLTTADFQQFLKDETGIGEGETDVWLYGPGIPQSAKRFPSPKREKIEALAREWASGKASNFVIPDGENWGYIEWLLFTNELLRAQSVPQDAMISLQTRYKLDDKSNIEILQNWYTLVAKFKFEPAYPRLKQFLDGRIGRAKVLIPIYKYLKASGEETLARQIYEASKPRYHPITRSYIDRILPN